LRRAKMPAIRKSVDLRYHYNEISEYCHKWKVPVHITKNGDADLVVLSEDEYDAMTGRQELYRLIDEGLQDIEDGNVMSYDQMMDGMYTYLAKYGIERGTSNV
jgi:PHD/YefM family antitoxin component YafN of YafNO toxin-antitoxin module